jgi:murein DD-endopeptidase MepM/ murein hydrolase activator NlpD
MAKSKAMPACMWGRAALVIAMALALTACGGRARVAYVPAPGSFFEVPVRQGDSVASIAKRYQVNEDDIVAINNLPQRDNQLRAKTVRIPAYGQLKDERRPAAQHFARNAPVESRPVAAKAGPKAKPGAAGKGGPAKGGKGKPAATKPAPKVQTTKLDPPKQQPQSTDWWNDWLNPIPNRQSPAAQKKFLWPVNGQVVSNFGQGPGQLHNDGINILAQRGTPVRAAEAGTVTYVGSEIKGYGNLVLIKHNDGYVTAYAHSDKVTVKRGDTVKRGQPIAFAGATGGVSQPQLHFELRRNAKPVDPAPYLVATSES